MVWTCTGGIADMFAKVAEDGAARQGERGSPQRRFGDKVKEDVKIDRGR